MTYILDTNIVSALMKGDPRCAARLAQADKSAVSIPQPVIAEIAYGIERLPKSKRRDSLRQKFELVILEIPRAQWDDKVSEHFAHIKASLEKQGKRIEDFDAAIAAHALATSSILVTANVEQMNRVPGIRIENWSL